MRYIVLVSLVAALALLGAGCGGEGSGEDSGGQYEDSGGQYEDSGSPENAPAPGPTNAVTAVAAFPEEECLREASESRELGVEISDPKQVPNYEVVDENEAEVVKDLEVVTEARSREDLMQVSEKLRYENRESDAISIDFYNESGDGGDGRQDAGLALIFNTREAACRAFQYPVEKQNEIASQSNGITVLSVEGGV